MPGMLTTIRYFYPAWLSIKWLVIVTIVLRSGGCGGDYGESVQRPTLEDGWITISSPIVDGMTSAHCTVFITPDTLMRTA